MHCGESRLKAALVVIPTAGIVWFRRNSLQQLTPGRMQKPFTIVVALLVSSSLLSGCAAWSPRAIPPQRLMGDIEPVGMPNVRIWADASPVAFETFIRSGALDVMAEIPPPAKIGGEREFNIVAISGGADGGAFAAGLIIGWGDAGARPEFDIVTGVSVGALIAPFVYLGRNRDPQLKEVFRGYSQIRVFKPSISAPLFGSALLDSSPLESLISKYVDRRFLDDVAREHDKGRLLLVGTTNLDAQRSVVWNMGHIAKSRNPHALALFRKVLLASSSIPGVFPPVRIEVARGATTTYEELHVDGGVTQQVFVPPVPPARASERVAQQLKKRVFIIRNDKVAPEWEPVESGLFTVSARSIATLIKNQGIGDLYRIYAATKRDGVEFNLAAVPNHFSVARPRPFDLQFMRALYDVGYQSGYFGHTWVKVPPGINSAIGASR